MQDIKRTSIQRKQCIKHGKFIGKKNQNELLELRSHEAVLLFTINMNIVNNTIVLIAYGAVNKLRRTRTRGAHINLFSSYLQWGPLQMIA